MTTPTTNISFSSIQTEFGGANPISLSEYVKGGTYVPSNQATSGTDGNAIPTSSSGVRMGMFRGLTKVTFSVSGGNFTSFLNNAVSPQVSIEANGTASTKNSSNVMVTAGNWGSPTTANIGTGYWIKVELGAGAAAVNGDPISTWLQLDIVRTWNFGAATIGNIKTRSLTYIISSNSSGTAQVGSGTLTLTSDRT